MFAGTRVPVQTLLDYLQAGEPLGEFLDDFPIADAGDGFEVLVTVDQRIRHQQNLQASVAVIVLVAPTNPLADLIPRVAGALAALAAIRPGEVVEVTT